ncbi:hypothetical protein AB6E04_03300 [Vibrio amylolyticus]
MSKAEKREVRRKKEEGRRKKEEKIRGLIINMNRKKRANQSHW